MGKMVEKTATLNEQDELWVSYRHKHIANVMVFVHYHWRDTDSCA